MKRLWILCALSLSGEVSLTDGCSYEDVLKYLNLTRKNELFTSPRPVRDWRQPTVVYLDVLLYAIVAVNEKFQLFTPLIWTSIAWKNEFISWDPRQFCGIRKVPVPKVMLWRPDLGILENTSNKESRSETMFLYITYDGTVTEEETFRVVSTCKMDMHKFPFDTQNCAITFSSYIHRATDLLLQPSSNSSFVTQRSWKFMTNEGEWEFLDMSVIWKRASFEQMSWDELKYMVVMKRRPLLYIVIFLLPVLIFLVLDIASFFISDLQGEKLSFKVTVLLANSVMLLMLNDILPSTSNRTPLIAIYCIVIFAFMWLGILETILVAYLEEKDSMTKTISSTSMPSNAGTKEDEDIYAQKEHGRMSFGSDGELRTTAMGDPAKGEEKPRDHQVQWRILREMQALRWKLFPHTLGSSKGKEWRWKAVAKCIDTTYFSLNLLSCVLFLLYISVQWLA